MSATALAVMAAVPALAASQFLTNMRKAQRYAEPDGRAHFYTLAIDAWGPREDDTLLAQCHFGRGEALVELWKFAEAEPDLSKALDKDPGNAKAYLLRGKARLRQDRFADSAKDLAEYVGHRPDSLEGWVLLGEAQLKAGKQDDASWSCKHAQEAAGDDGRGWLCEARVWMARKDWPAAEKILDAAVQKSGPRLPDAYTERAAVKVAQGRHDKAVEDYSAAIVQLVKEHQDLGRSRAIEPVRADQRQRTARALYGRGRVLEFLAQMRQALTDFNEACSLGHENACRRAKGLEPEPEAPARKPEPAKKAVQEESPKPEPKRRKSKPPKSEGGERIYGG